MGDVINVIPNNNYFFSDVPNLALGFCHFGTFFEQSKWSYQRCFAPNGVPKQVRTNIGRTDERTDARTNTQRFWEPLYTIGPSGNNLSLLITENQTNKN